MANEMLTERPALSCPRCGAPLPEHGCACAGCGAEVYLWVARAGRSWGPYDLATVRYLYACGRLGPTEQVTCDPAGRWLPAGQALASAPAAPPAVAAVAGPAFAEPPAAATPPTAPTPVAAAPRSVAGRRSVWFWVGFVILLLAILAATFWAGYHYLTPHVMRYLHPGGTEYV